MEASATLPSVATSADSAAALTSPISLIVMLA